MKRLITSLTVLLLCASAHADTFGPNDKVLFFSTDVLIEVIERNFDKNLQLDVANKYIELMDSATHSVSIADLTTICATGQIDSAKCRNFINDLFTTMDIGDTVRPFYWADYVSANPEPIRLAVFASGDGYHKHDGLAPGQWAITFGWMNKSSFRMQYPKIQSILGTSACTSESGTKYTADSSKNFEPNEISGNHCWCKMAGPEESEWVYTIEKSGGRDGNCDRSCALECISALRQEQDMRAAMFTAVKLNGSNEHGTIDPKKIKDEFKPCEFDWGKDTYWESWGEMDLEKFHFWDKFRPREPMGQWFVDSNKDSFSYSLKDWEWEAGGTPWLTSKKFKCVYPNVKTIKGTATINNKKPKSKMWLSVTQDSFSARQINGGNCWCKMTYPEESAWVWIRDFDQFPDHTYTDTEKYNMCISSCGYAFSRRSYQIIDAFRPIGKK